MIKNLLFISVIFTMLFSLTACSFDESTVKNEKNSQTGIYKKISPKEALSLMESDEDILILDVRTKEEYDEGYIKNALLLPYDEISKDSEILPPDKSKKILIYCRSGRRSEIAANTIIKLGYENVYDFGGINDWPYDIYK